MAWCKTRVKCSASAGAASGLRSIRSYHPKRQLPVTPSPYTYRPSSYNLLARYTLESAELALDAPAFQSGDDLIVKKLHHAWRPRLADRSLGLGRPPSFGLGLIVRRGPLACRQVGARGDGPPGRLLGRGTRPLSPPRRGDPDHRQHEHRPQPRGWSHTAHYHAAPPGKFAQFALLMRIAALRDGKLCILDGPFTAVNSLHYRVNRRESPRGLITIELFVAFRRKGFCSAATQNSRRSYCNCLAQTILYPQPRTRTR